jgi:hypothetical protein
MMTDMEILQLADRCGVFAVTKHEWDGKKFNHTDDQLDGDGAALIVFARQLLQRTWVSLTDEDVGDLSDFAYANDEEFVRNVEAKIKEKQS